MTTFIRLGLSVAVAAMISTGVQAADVSPLMTSPPSANGVRAWLDVLGGSVFLDGRTVRRYGAVRVADGTYGC